MIFLIWFMKKFYTVFSFNTLYEKLLNFKAWKQFLFVSAIYV